MRRGTRVGQAYVAISADGSGINEDIVNSVDEAGPGVEKAGEEHGEKYGDNFSEGFFRRIRGKIGDRLSTALHGDEVGGRAGDDAGESFVDRMSDKVRNMGDRIGSELSDRLASNPEQIRRGLDRAFDDDSMDRLGDRIGSRISHGIAESIVGGLEDADIGGSIERALHEAVSGNGKGGKGGTKKRGLGDIVGRLFGAGSRNNFLNAFGSSIGGIASLITKVTSGAISMFSTFSKGFSSASEGASFFSKVLAGGGAVGSKIGMSFATIAAAAPVALAAIGAVGLALTILVSIASALLAVVAALAATIASALVGAAAVAAGALGALAVAAGLVTIAFTSMTNAQSKALKSAFQPLKAEATGLGQIMLSQMVPAFERWSHNLQVALALAAPLASVMGGALARAGNIFTASLSGPGLRMFIDALSVTLPRIVVNLSSAFGGFINGVAGVFTAIMPFVLRFSNYLSRVAADFARWATSARGQNSITDFVDRALNALGSLWNFIKAVGGLINALFFSKSGQRAGNNIFDSMAGALRRFTDYISKEDRLEHWFSEGQRFAKALGKTIKTVSKILEDMNDSRVIDVIFFLANAAENAYDWFDKLPTAVTNVINPLNLLFGPVNGLINAFKELTGLMNDASSWKPPPGSLSGSAALQDLLVGPMTTHPGFIGPVAPDMPNSGGNNTSLTDLINAGNEALNNTYESAGGYMPDPTTGKGPKHAEGAAVADEWVNTYGAFVAQILKAVPTLAEEIRKTFREARRVLGDALAESAASFATLLQDSGKGYISAAVEATRSIDPNALTAGFAALIEQTSQNVADAVANAATNGQELINQAVATRDQMIASAQAAVQAAASKIASATNEKDAKAAFKELDAARKALDLAEQKGRALVDDAVAAASKMINEANASQAQVDKASAILAAQGVYTFENAQKLIQGIKVQNATLADYAEARRWVAESLATANQRLADAIALRDNYSTQVADSLRSFGSLLSAQAKTIDGITQALTSGDITDNLRDRLAKIKQFQENLRLLLAAGVSDSVYKQIVDAGAEQGNAYAEAILAGGQGAVSEVNSLADQIDLVSTAIGSAAASQMYQAGVDAAQGLVDGLLSLSAELDSAAAELGAAIANAIKRELGIASPSRVLMALMDNVGDGAVIGLDNQQGKVGAASSRLAGQIAVSPEVAAYAARQGTSPTEDGVSGNDGSTSDRRFRDLIVHTPTEDPEAVAMEVLNEVTGRL